MNKILIFRRFESDQLCVYILEFSGALGDKENWIVSI